MRKEAISPYPHSHHNLNYNNKSQPSTSFIPPPLSIHNPKIPISILSPKFPKSFNTSSPIFLLITFSNKSQNPPSMATMNSSVLACNYAISGSDLSSKIASVPSMASSSPASIGQKLPVIKAEKAKESSRVIDSSQGRRAALACLAAALFTTAASSSSANAGVIEEYLEKSKANKELNDKKRLATSGANFARAFTVQFGTCKFPENFTGCQDLAKQKKVPFISDDLALECEGKDKYKCGSNVFWKW